MPRINLILASRFRSSTERASILLETTDFDALFLGFPENFGESLNLYRLGIISEEELWNDYINMTGLSGPFANSLRYRLEPLIKKLPLIAHDHDFEIYGFEDFQYHIRLRGFAEQQLLLEFKSRATGKINPDEWRALLREELETTKLLEEKIVNNLQEKCAKHNNSVFICAGLVNNIKRKLSPIFNVKVICLERYWKSPLEVLKTLFILKGFDNIPDNIVKLCIKQHLEYLDYILLYDNIDTAHEAWVRELKPYMIKKG